MSDEHDTGVGRGPDSPEQKVEADNASLRGIAYLLVGLALFLVVAGFGLRQFYLMTTESLRDTRENAVVSKDLTEIRAENQKLLTTYGVVDEKEGIYRVPIARAVEMVLQRPELLEGVVRAAAAGSAAGAGSAGDTKATPTAAGGPEANAKGQRPEAGGDAGAPSTNSSGGGAGGTGGPEGAGGTTTGR